jgi:hypothetical protein
LLTEKFKGVPVNRSNSRPLAPSPNIALTGPGAPIKKNAAMKKTGVKIFFA